MLTQTRLKEVLSYDPETGLWVRLSGRYAGPAGTRHKKGYTQISVDGRLYLSAPLAWLYMTGEWPQGQVDHWDHDRANDRWKNLREATPSQNQANRSVVKNASGLKGVRKLPSGRFMARIKQGRTKYIGSFNTAEEAHAAYLHEARQMFGEFAYGGVS